jgi:hypothetical protein
VDPVKGFVLDEPLKGFDAESEFTQGEGPFVPEAARAEPAEVVFSGVFGSVDDAQLFAARLTYPVPLGEFTVEVFASHQNLQGPPSSDQSRQAGRWAAAGNGADADLELSEHGALAAGEADVAGEGEFAAGAPGSPANR